MIICVPDILAHKLGGMLTNVRVTLASGNGVAVIVDGYTLWLRRAIGDVYLVRAYMDNGSPGPYAATLV